MLAYCLYALAMVGFMPLCLGALALSLLVRCCLGLIFG